MAEARDQQKERRNQRFYDQHRRPYEAIVEIKTGHPCGPIRAIGFNHPAQPPAYPLWPHAPLTPPETYLVVDPDEPGKLTINYDEWLTQARATHQIYQRRLEETAREMYKGDAERYYDDPTPELLRAVGAAPPPLEPIVAAMRGKSRWILGLPGTDGEPIAKPPWARAFFPDRQPDPRFTDSIDDFPAFTDDVGEDEPEADASLGLEIDDELTGEQFAALNAAQAIAAVEDEPDELRLRVWFDAESARKPKGRATVLDAFAARGVLAEV